MFSPIYPSNPFRLSPSSTFLRSMTLSEMVQLVCVSPSGCIDFFLSQKIAQFVASLPPFNLSFFLPSLAAYKISGNSEYLSKFHWIAPVFSMAIATRAALPLYAGSSSWIAKGIVGGVHSYAMMFFAYTPTFASRMEVISLRGELNSVIINYARLVPLSREQIQLKSEQAEKMAALSFFISSVSLTLLTKNIILANAVAHPLAAFVRVAAMRALCELELRYV